MRCRPLLANLCAAVVLTTTLLSASACGSSTPKSTTRLTVTTTTSTAPGPETTTTLEPEGGVGRQFFVYSPTIGDCVDLRAMVDGKAVTTRALPGIDGTPKSAKQLILRLDCDLPHQYEVIGAVSAGLPSSPEPTNAELVVAAKRLCPATFASYVGIPYQTSTLEVGWILPSPDQLARGDQKIGCTALDPKAKLVGTILDAKR